MTNTKHLLLLTFSQVCQRGEYTCRQLRRECVFWFTSQSDWYHRWLLPDGRRWMKMNDFETDTVFTLDIVANNLSLSLQISTNNIIRLSWLFSRISHWNRTSKHYAETTSNICDIFGWFVYSLRSKLFHRRIIDTERLIEVRSITRLLSRNLNSSTVWHSSPFTLWMCD